MPWLFVVLLKLFLTSLRSDGMLCLVPFGGMQLGCENVSGDGKCQSNLGAQPILIQTASCTPLSFSRHSVDPGNVKGSLWHHSILFCNANALII